MEGPCILGVSCLKDKPVATEGRHPTKIRDSSECVYVNPMKGVMSVTCILMYQPQFWPITMCLEIRELDILGGSIPVEPLKWRYKNPTVAIASNTIALNEMGCLWVRHQDPGVMQDFGKFSDPKTKSDSDPRNVGIYMLISNVEICPDKYIQITMGPTWTNLLILWLSVLRIESWVCQSWIKRPWLINEGVPPKQFLCE